MKTPLFRVRFGDGVEGNVLQVDLGEYTETAHGMTGSVEIRLTGHVALVELDNGTLTSRTLEGATILQPTRPVPVAMPIPGGGLVSVHDCEHERLSDDRAQCLGCGMEFVACRGCYVLGSGVPVYHGKPECPITDEEWAEVMRKERADG